MNKPLIGISTCFEKQGAHYYHQTGDKYIAAISNVFNGLPLLIPAIGTKLHRQKLLDSLDGILFTGSYSNVEPHHMEALKVMMGQNMTPNVMPQCYP